MSAEEAAPPAPSPSSGGPRRPLLERLCLHRPDLRAWALYDCANSAFFTTVVAAVFPIYFRDVVFGGDARADTRFAYVTSASLLSIALVSPLLGALADAAGWKKRLLAAFLALGVTSTALLFFVGAGDGTLASALYFFANVGVAGSFVFYDALLPALVRGKDLDRLSSTGYAVGYLGGGLLLAANLAWIQRPQWFGLPAGPSTLPARLSFLSVAVWWLLFSIPLFLRVKEPARAPEADERAGRPSLGLALARLRETFRDLRRHRQAFWMLLAFLAYSDGIGTIIRMAAIYGREIGIERGDLIAALLIVQFLGIPCALLFGALAGRIGAKRAILLALAAYLAICVFAWRMSSAREFYVLAISVAAVQGGCQALSRSLFASLVPAHRSGEFFGLFGVLDRFAGVLGPATFGFAIQATGSSRLAVLSIALFFGLGGLLLARVDVEAGRRAARAAEAELAPAPGT